MFVTFYSSFVNLDLCECMTKIIEFCAKQQSAQNSKVHEELIVFDMIYSKKVNEATYHFTKGKR